MTDLEALMREAVVAAHAEYPIPDDMARTEKTVRYILQEGFVKGYMKAKGRML